MRMILYVLVVLVFIILCLWYYAAQSRIKDAPLYTRMSSLEALGSIIPSSAEALATLIKKAEYAAHIEIAQIITIPDAQRTYENTIAAFDHLVALSDLALMGNMAAILEYLSSHDALREAAHAGSIEIRTFFVEQVMHNETLFNSLKAYVNGNGAQAPLTDEQRYFISETMHDFERAGMLLPAEKRAELLALDKELTQLCADFDKHIAEEKRTITVPREGLAGLDDQFIAALKKTETGDYLLGVDYPTYFKVMRHCAVEDTRKQLAQLFENRAYPENKTILEAILAKRDARAKLVGFDSYAAYDLANQMAKNPTTIEQFLHKLLMRTIEKEEQELVRIVGPDILTTPLKPWNLAYLKEQYKQKTYAVDENKIREYFPVEKTIQGLIAIYEQFFGLRFVRVAAPNLWSNELYALEVYNQKTNDLIGIFILDLYPRPNKFSHAAHITLIPAITGTQPEISVIMANFPRATADMPALLTRDDVSTFFHEFGHAIHALLGRTKTASFSGTGVKHDFVEMPSQMLEEWLWNAEILRAVSSHYKTGDPMPDELIANIIQLKQYDAAIQVRTQARYALLSLRLHQETHPDLDAVLHSIYNTYAPHIAFDSENHFYASFGHLTDYGAKYYGYLWSKVFALDLFNEIQKTGLLHTATGRRYAEVMLVPGGSKPPHLLLQSFLGREPRIDSFIKDLGL